MVCLTTNLLGPFLNTLSQIIPQIFIKTAGEILQKVAHFVNTITKSVVELLEQCPPTFGFNIVDFGRMRQPHKIVQYTQTNCRLLPTNCLNVFNHF